MKIGLTWHTLAQLTGGESPKNAGAGVKKGSMGRLDVPILSDVPDKAIVKYLRTIDEILSDIIRIVDDSTPPAGSECAAAISQKMRQLEALTSGDAVIYLPDTVPAGEEGQEGKGELIIIKDDLALRVSDLSGSDTLHSPEVISREAARALSCIDAGIGLRTGDPNSMIVRDKFVISVDASDNAPVPLIIRHGPSGVTVASNGSDAGAIGAGTASIVEKVAAFLTGRAAGDSPGDALHAGEAAPGNAVERHMYGMAAHAAATGRATAAFDLSPGFDPIKAAKDAASFLSAENRALRSEKVQETAYEEGQVPAPGIPLDGMTLPDEFSGVAIRVIPSTMMRSDNVETAGTAGRQELISERLELLAEAIGGVIGCGDETGEAADDVQAGLEVIKASVKEAVRESVQTAMRGLAGQSGLLDEVLEGIRINEKGLLEVDKEAFAETLTGRKDETTRFVQGFSNSLHDRITYFFHPFAGLYAGGTGGAVVRGAGNKEGIACEEEGAKANFEKRMNEIRMLLESSYQLREVFVGIGSSARAGQGNREK